MHVAKRIVLASLLVASPTLGQDLTPEARQAVGRVVGIGVLLSSADFVGGGSFDTDDGATIKVRHIPMHQSFGSPESRFRPWGTLAFGHVSDSEQLDFFGEPLDRGKLTADSLAAIVGAEIDLGSGWYLEPSVGAIFSRIDVELNYRNPQTELLQPLIDGVFFNWEADAWTLSAATRLGYKHDWSSGVGLNVATQGVGLWTDPVNTDHPVQNTSTNMQYLRLQGRLRLPLGVAVRGNDLYVLPEVTHSLLSSDVERTLATDSLTQMSLRVVTDLPEAPPESSLWRRLFPRAVGLNVGYTTSDYISGWAFGITFRNWESGW